MIKMIMGLDLEEIREMMDMYALKKMDECSYGKEGKVFYSPLGDDVGWQTYNRYIEMLSDKGIDKYNDMIDCKQLKSARG